MKRLLLILFAIFLIVSPVQGEFFKDVIVTSPTGIWTDSRAYTTLNAAVTAIGANEQDLYIAKEEVVTTLVIPANIRLHFLKDGAIANSNTLTLNTKNIHADHQIFTGAGAVNFASGTEVQSIWFEDFETAITQTSNDTVTLIVNKADTLLNSAAVGNNVRLKWDASNLITIGAGQTLSNIGDIDAPGVRLFVVSGAVAFRAFSPLKEIRADWFGNSLATLDIADNAAAAVGKPLLIPSGAWVIDVNVALSNIKVLPDVDLQIATNITLTINGNFDAGLYQVFSCTGTGKVAFGTGAVEKVYAEWWGAVGDGVTSDSAAFASFMTTVLGSSVQGELVAGRTYYLDSWTAATGAGTLKLISQGATIKGDGASSFAYGPFSINCSGVTFDTWVDVPAYGASGGAVNATVAEWVFKDCKFYNITGTVLNWYTTALSVPANAKLERLVVKDCDFNGAGTRAVNDGVHLSAKYDSVLISGSRFINMSGRPAVIGYNVYAIQPYMTKAIIEKNIVSDIDTGANPSNAFLVYGQEVFIDNNFISEITKDDATTLTTDCEGIYTKAKYFHITGNTLINAGRQQGFIATKGSVRGLTVTPNGYNSVVANNVLFTDDVNTVGINIGTSETNCNGNVLEGFAKNAIYISGNPVNDINVHHNIIKNMHGQYSIVSIASGDNIAIDDNIIDVQDNASLFAGDCAAIYYAPSASQENVSISRNKFKSLTGALGGTFSYGLFISPPVGAVITNLAICGNQIDIADRAFRVRNTAPVNFTMTGNQFSNLVDATQVVWSVTPSPQIIKDNIGLIDTPAVPATTVEERNTNAFPVRVTISGGTVTVIAKGPTSGALITTGATSGAFILQPAEYIAITYTVAPTWVWTD